MSDYTALSYSIIFRVQFEGVSSKTMYLKCPLQVAYPFQPEISTAQVPLFNAVDDTEHAIRDVPCCSVIVAGSDMNEVSYCRGVVRPL
jgi:hypothetical protein